jgi:hypothetical protein
MANHSTLMLGTMVLAGALLACKLLEQDVAHSVGAESSAVAPASATPAAASAVAAGPSARASASAGPFEPPALFEGIGWSTPQVMAQTRERLARLGLRHAELPPLADIDEPADLRHLPAAWRPLALQE